MGSAPFAPDSSVGYIEQWRRELAELGGANTLLWFDDHGRGVLDLTGAHPAGTARFFSSGSARLSELVRESYAYSEAARRGRLIRSKSVELQEDRGIDSCWLGIGLAHWEVRGAGRRPLAPVLLRRVRMRPVVGHTDDLALTLDSDPGVNPAFVAYLSGEHGVELDVEALAALAKAASASDPRRVFEEIARACESVPGFAIDHRFVISTFNVSKTDLVADLMDPGALAPMHPVVGALCADPEATDAVRAVPPPVDPAGVQTTPAVLPIDSAQRAALDAVLAGAHLTVSGAPGTGKTQTIAALIAELAAQGRPILLVSHKLSAIESVQHRLAQVGLDDLIMHLGDGRPGPEFEAFFNRRIQEAVAAEGAQVDSVPEPDVTAARLQAHHEAMHAPQRPWDVSLRETIEKITELGHRRPAPHSRARLSSDDLQAMSPTQRDEAGRRLLGVARAGAWSTGPEGDPWYGATVVGEQQAARARSSVSELAEGRLAAHRALIEELFDQVGLPTPSTMREEEDCLELIRQVEATLEVFRPEVFSAPLADLAAATGARGYRREHGQALGIMERRRLVSQAQDLLRPGPRPGLHGVLVQAERQRRHWRSLAGGGAVPAVAKGLGEALDAHERLREELEWLAGRLETTADGGDLLDLSFDSLQARVTRLHRASDRLAVLPQVTHDLDTLRAQGLGPLLDDLAMRRVPAEEVVAELEFIWWTSLFDQLSTQLDGQVITSSDQMSKLLDDLAAEDDAARSRHVAHVRAKVDERVRFVVRNLPEQVRAVQHGLHQGSSLRELLPHAPELLMALMPCWAMSPLLVPAHVSGGVWFDVLAMDEASSVSTAEAIPSVRRATQTVLFGDERLVQPRAFAVDAGREPATRRASSVFEELLPLVPAVELRTHYRSHDARLFEFANLQAYAGRVQVFPANDAERCVRLDVVRGEAPVASEIDQVVDRVSANATSPTPRSMMVVTLTEEHAERISSELLRRARSDAALGRFLDASDSEPFVVRTAERAHGFTRDVVLLSTGVRVDDGGALAGAAARALEGEDGHRQLLVASTRARRLLVVVVGFGPDEVAIGELRAKGTVMFRDLLTYAQMGGPSPAGSPSTGQPTPKRPRRRRRTASSGSVLDRPVAVAAPAALGHVLAELAERLRGDGFSVRPDRLVARPSLDLVVGHSHGADSAQVAIDTDGVALQAMHNVRDRDLVRPEQLRRRGWTYERVLLHEVFSDPAQQLARLASVVDARGEAADLGGTGEGYAD
ncbi:AAA family ATPase [Yimella sp. cx-573]|nr:AAA family ATPase [Yimella sp. cx-573]